MSRSARKMEHIQHVLATRNEQVSGFDQIRFIPNSLPNISYVNINLSSRLQSIPLSSPILINAMTGGARETAEINQKLAIIAKEKKLAMAVGSQMAAVRDASLRHTYQVVRKENPDGVVFANLGAEASVDQARQAVEMIEADGLQIHLNVMQELLMPEGDRDFTGYLKKIENIVSTLSVPVIVKEVGFGMSRETIRQLIEAGVRIIDVGGAGGTNFAQVENRRSARPLSMFENWGLTTPQSLLEYCQVNTKGASIVATGGIQDGLDAAKAISLGADAVGMSGFFLKLVTEETMEKCFTAVDQLHHQLRIAMTALGAASLEKLRHVPLTLSPELRDWAEQRGIAVQKLALERGS